MTTPKPLEIMVFISNPEGFETWPIEKQLQRYQCIIKWHEHVSMINPVKVPYVWGTHQVLSQVRLSPIQDMYVLVYRVQSLSEFDELMFEDPLRDCSHYKTVLLTDIAKDLEDDKKRFEDALKQLTDGRDKKAIAEIERQRSRFKLAPDYVGKYKSIKPTNPIVNYFKNSFESFSERPLEILIHGMNPPEYMAWDDARKLIHYEKVLWWHDHIAQMLHEGRVSHVWVLMISAISL